MTPKEIFESLTKESCQKIIEALDTRNSMYLKYYIGDIIISKHNIHLCLDFNYIQVRLVYVKSKGEYYRLDLSTFFNILK